MRIAMRFGIVLAISVFSVIGDVLYSNAMRAAGQSFDFDFVITVRTIVLVAFYLMISIFTLNLLVHNERNLFFSLSLISVGLVLIWMSSFPDVPLFLRDLFTWELTTARLGLTIHSGTFFTAVGLLRLLPETFLPKRIKQ
jgi:hypothetical protein